MPRTGRRGQLLRAEPGRLAEAHVARAVQRSGHQRPSERHRLAAERHAVLRPCRGRGALPRRHLRLPEGALRRRARPRPAGAHGQTSALRRRRTLAAVAGAPRRAAPAPRRADHGRAGGDATRCASAPTPPTCPSPTSAARASRTGSPRCSAARSTARWSTCSSRRCRASSATRCARRPLRPGDGDGRRRRPDAEHQPLLPHHLRAGLPPRRRASRRRSGWTTRACARSPRRGRAHAAGGPAGAPRPDGEHALLPPGRGHAASRRRAPTWCARWRRASWTRRWSGGRSPATRRRSRTCRSPSAPSRASRARRAWITASPWGCAGRSPNGAAASTPSSASKQGEIDAILREYGVPLLDAQGRLREP